MRSNLTSSPQVHWDQKYVPTSRSLQAVSCWPQWIWTNTQARTMWILVRKCIQCLHSITACTSFCKLGETLWRSWQSCPANFSSWASGGFLFLFLFSSLMNRFILTFHWTPFLCNTETTTDVWAAKWTSLPLSRHKTAFQSSSYPTIQTPQHFYCIFHLKSTWLSRKFLSTLVRQVLFQVHKDKKTKAQKGAVVWNGRICKGSQETDLQQP